MNVSLSVFSQTESEFPFLAKEQQSILYYIEGDSAIGQVKLKELPSFVSFKPEGEKKFQKLHVSKLRMLKVDTLVFIPLNYRPKELTGKNTSLVLLLLKGKIQLFQYFSFSTVGRKTKFETTYILKKEGVKTNDLSSTSFINFKSGIENYVRDFPELLEKIKNGDEGYQKKNIFDIIKVYNLKFLKSSEEMEFEAELNRRLELEKERIKEEMLNK